MQKFFISITKSGGKYISERLGIPHQHATAREFINEFGDEEWKDGFKFSIVRNPWDRAFAIYHHRLLSEASPLAESGIDFNGWVREVFKHKNPEFTDSEKGLMPQVEWLKSGDGKIDLDYVGRFENKHEDLVFLLKKFGMQPAGQFQRKPGIPAYQEFYDKDSQQIIEDWYAEDIETFSYRFI